MKVFSINLNASQKIGVTAISLFAVSHLLPAYDTFCGFACFCECWSSMCHPDLSDLGNWFYYSGLALSNILFVILAVGLFVSERGWRFRSIASVIILSNITSWSVLELWSGSSSIKIGYYVWLEAYVLLYFAHRAKVPIHSVEPRAAMA